MTALHIVDPASVLAEALTDASPDLMRSLLQTTINALLSADADAVAGAEWGKPSPDRVAQRNGYRHRELDTRVGTIDVAIPKLRQGTYFPEWLLERRKRAETALITVVADCYLAGVSTGVACEKVKYPTLRPFGILLRSTVGSSFRWSEVVCQKRGPSHLRIGGRGRGRP